MHPSSDWQAVLDSYGGLGGLGGPGARAGVQLTADRLEDHAVSVILTVDPAAAAPIDFADNLYGATAWAKYGSQWQRADTAEMRLMIAPSLAPGESATIQLPLAPGTPHPVRVLLAGTWVDVTR